MSVIDACIDVYVATGDIKWFQEAQRCLGWFLGRNDLNVALYDFETGGCCDGLQPDGVNENQGAESTISWLISLLKLNGNRFQLHYDRLLITAVALDPARTTSESAS
jgi:hypothetical protein